MMATLTFCIMVKNRAKAARNWRPGYGDQRMMASPMPCAEITPTFCSVQGSGQLHGGRTAPYQPLAGREFQRALFFNFCIMQPKAAAEQTGLAFSTDLLH